MLAGRAIIAFYKLKVQAGVFHDKIEVTVIFHLKSLSNQRVPPIKLNRGAGVNKL